MAIAKKDGWTDLAFAARATEAIELGVSSQRRAQVGIVDAKGAFLARRQHIGHTHADDQQMSTCRVLWEEKRREEGG